jgi:hypothetical protein
MRTITRTGSSIALALLLLPACGGSSAPPPSDVDEDDTCAGYSPSHQCMNPDNFELCRALEAECPGQVLVMESCPLQFSCPSADAEGADPDAPVESAPSESP